MWRYVLTLFVVAQTASAADYDWKLERDQAGVQVYTSVVAGSKFKAVKSTMIIETSLAELVALVRDVSACPDWAALCKKAEIVEIVSETELYVYTLNNLPWPVADRDAVAHVVWGQDPTDFSVTMTATVVSEKLPINRGVVRLSYGVTNWVFRPVADGRIEVVSLAHVDPGGATPAWLSNRLLVGAPYDTMVGMREVARSGRYADSSFDFMSEP